MAQPRVPRESTAWVASFSSVRHSTKCNTAEGFTPIRFPRSRFVRVSFAWASRSLHEKPGSHRLRSAYMTAYPIGSPERPVRVAVVGSGPAGFYTVDALVKNKQITAEVDLL